MSVAERWSRPLRAYLPHSIAATCAVVAAPLLVLWTATSVLLLEIPAPAVLLMALSVAFLSAAVASEIWERRPGASDIAFSELLFWSWYRLQRADQRLAASRRRVAVVDASPEDQLAVLQELSDALESKDPYTRGHSSRVERHAFNIAVALGLSLKEIDVLRKAASLHDVGKMRIPNRVLHKPGKLDDEERLLIEEHPVLGAWMVASIGDEEIVRTVRHHHERWDGAGYPDRIGRNEIPLFARIIAVADTYDAITSTRSYRAGGSRKRAVEVIRAESGTQFDPLVVDAFLTTLPATSPIVAGLGLGAGAQMIWRELTRWLHRFGSGGVAPAIGAVGTAVVLGAATFMGSGPVHPAPQLGDGATSSAPVRDGASSSGPAPVARRRAPSDKVLGKRITKKARSKSRPRRPDAKQGSSKDTGRGGSSDGEPNVTAAPAPTKSSTKPKTADAADAAAPATQPLADALDDVDDPKTGKGSDCDPGLGVVSEGSKLHCN